VLTFQIDDGTSSPPASARDPNPALKLQENHTHHRTSLVAIQRHITVYLVIAFNNVIKTVHIWFWRIFSSFLIIWLSM